MNNEILVNITGVSFKYGQEKVLDDINLEIKKGDFLGLIGPNGSGKTTLLKIILGLLTPSSGTVSLFGQRIQDFKERRKIGYVPQKAGSTPTDFPITVGEIVGMGIPQQNFFGFTSTRNQKAITTALEAVGLGKQQGRLLSSLSGGQQQRVFIARALVSNPELLILDEPTVGVDIEAQNKFYTLLRDLNKRFNLTLVLVSHDIDVVANEVSSLACLNCKLIYHGTPKEFIKEDYLKKLYGKDLRFILHGH